MNRQPQSFLVSDRGQWLILSTFTGLLTFDTVDELIQSIEEKINLVPDEQLFSLLIDCSQWLPVEEEISYYLHNRIGIWLSKYGLSALSDEWVENSVQYTSTHRGIVCEAVSFQYQAVALQDVITSPASFFAPVLQFHNWRSQ